MEASCTATEDTTLAADTPPLPVWDDSSLPEGWDVENGPMGPQGVLLPKQAYRDDSAVEHAVAAETEESYDSPQERAQARFQRLSTAFSTTLAIVAQMYRDEDWRYLRKDDGGSYTSLVEVCQVAMNKSAAMARRYVQGARDFYLPLSAVMVEGATLDITSSDVATLGSDGLGQVVSEARERLEGVSNPEEATHVVQDSLQHARERRENTEPTPPDADMDPAQREWEGASTAREYYEAPAPDASGPMEYCPAPDDDEAPSPPGGSTSSVSAATEADLIEPLLENAPLFHDPEALDGLPMKVKRVVRAMLTLADADVEALTPTLTFDNRGIVTHAREAEQMLARIRAVAESQPWVLRELGDA